jgi:hypothetical protein
MIRFEGAAPSPDEVAAILAVLDGEAPEPPKPATPAPWKVAARRPDLDIDDVRAAVAATAASNPASKPLW